MRRIPMKCICCEMQAYETYVCEIHACERHVHKSVGVHLIGVCLALRERFPMVH